MASGTSTTAVSSTSSARGAKLYQNLNEERLERGMDTFEDYPAILSREEREASRDCAKEG